MPLSGLGCCCHIWENSSLLAFFSRSTLITWSSLCDFSIWICLWILSYTDYMVLSLWSFNVNVLVNSVIHWSHGSFNLYVLVTSAIHWSNGPFIIIFQSGLLVNSVIHWSHGSLIVILQSVCACEFSHTLITWFFLCDLWICICLWLPSCIDQWSFLCDLSICICLWILSYTDHMVFSLWSFNLYLLVNSVIQWSHGLLFMIFQSVFACEFRYTLITWSSLCDLSISICLWILLYSDPMIFLFVIFQSVFACEFCYTVITWPFSLWSFTCDCEQISFCNYHKWTCTPFQCEYVRS